jgi:hypothetical protein
VSPTEHPAPNRSRRTVLGARLAALGRGSGSGAPSQRNRCGRALLGPLVALFLLIPAASALAHVSVELKGHGAGTVTSSPAGIECSNDGGGNTCDAEFANFSLVELSAAPGAGFTFSEWSADPSSFFAGTCASGSANPCKLFNLASSTIHITATFACVTPIAPPATTTGQASAGQDPLTRTLEGSVNPNGCGLEETYFEYGTTTEYGNTTTTKPEAGALGTGSAAVPVTAETDFLEPSTTYHYRLVAVGPGGTARGEDQAFTTGPAPSDECPNALFRAEQGTLVQHLPDCMALEMVSPPEKAGQPAKFPSVSLDGQRVSFLSLAPLGENPPPALGIAGSIYVAGRGGAGWSTERTLPALALRARWETASTLQASASFTPDFSRSLLIGATGPQWEQGIAQAYDAGLGGSFRLLSTPLEPLTSGEAIQSGKREVVGGARFQAASADHSHLYFGAGNAPGTQTTYLPGDPGLGGPGAEQRNTYLVRLGADGQPLPKPELLQRDKAGKVWGGECGARLGGIGRANTVDPAPNGDRNQGAVSADGHRTYLSARAAQPQTGPCEAGEVTRPFLGTFGAAAQPSFGAPTAIAVRQSSGDLLTIDSAAGTVSRYHEDGTPADFSALGTNVIDGAGPGDETPQGGLSFGAANEAQIAVDDSGGPADGDIYVTQSGAHLIDVFAADGEYLGQLTEYKEGADASGSLVSMGEACGVAVDPSGAVYVGDYEGEVHKFEPTADPPVNTDNTANFSTSFSPCTLAAGAGPSAGSIFVTSYGGAVTKLDASTGAEGYVVSEGANTTVSVDPASGHVFVASGAEILEYEAGAAEASLLASTELQSTATGVAVDETSGNVYVSREGDEHLEVYGPLPEAHHLRILQRLETPSGVQISELVEDECARTSPPCSSADGDDLYQGASLDQTKVYFTTNRQLADSDLDGSSEECDLHNGEREPLAVPGCDLYLYDADRPEGERLIQVSAGEELGLGVHERGSEADLYNAITAISADGQRAYFVATGVLTNDKNPEEETATAGEPNLYMFDLQAWQAAGETGGLAFIGTLDSSDGIVLSGAGNHSEGLWGGDGTWQNYAYPVPVLSAAERRGEGDAEEGGDGHLLVFRTHASLTPADADGGRLDVYRYDADAGTLDCVSCAPGSSEGEPDEAPFDVHEVGGEGPLQTDFAEHRRWVSEDGESLVFRTAQGLLPGDRNAVTDDYLWRGGQLYRLTRGAVSQEVKGAPVLSPDGATVAFATAAPLLPTDGDTAEDVYVARADGGFPPPPPPETCRGEECRGKPSEVPPLSGAGTAVLQGAGNLKQKPCKKPKVRRHGKCVRKPKRPKRHHRHKAHNRHTRHFNADRRATR